MPTAVNGRKLLRKPTLTAGLAAQTIAVLPRSSTRPLRLPLLALLAALVGCEGRIELPGPLGVGGGSLFEWFLPTRTFQQVLGGGADGGTTGIDDDCAARGDRNIGASILGRNMFGPIRGAWPDEAWKGWGGANPPYHTPVFVLTNHARNPLTMEGGTVFHFVTDGIHAALQHATEAAGGKDIRLGGGVATIRQYLRAGLCTWPSPRSSSAAANICSPGSTLPSSVMLAPSTCRLRVPRTSSSPSTVKQIAKPITKPP